MHFFTEAFATEYKDPDMLFDLYFGRAKLNLLLAQFGKCKEDCLEALKIKDTNDQMWLVLARSRYFLEKYAEGAKYAMEGLKKCPNNLKLANMIKLFGENLEREKKIVDNVSSLQALKQDKKLEVYRNLRSKKVKLGKRVHHLPESLDL